MFVLLYIFKNTFNGNDSKFYYCFFDLMRNLQLLATKAFELCVNLSISYLFLLFHGQTSDLQVIKLLTVRIELNCSIVGRALMKCLKTNSPLN